jgi:acyl-CoA thioester hydrolase
MEQESINFKVRTSIQIRFNDIDGLGHVNNSVYSQYFDQGRMDYFQFLNGGQRVDWHKAKLVIASTKIDFRKPLFLDEPADVLTKVYTLGNKSMKMIQHLVDPLTEEIKATCKSVMVGFDNTALQSIELPAHWRQAILAFETDVEQ